MIKYLLILLTAVSLSIALPSCVTVPQSNGTSTGQISKDPVVIAEATTQIAYDTFDTLFILERQNRDLVLRYAPAVHAAVDSLRMRAPGLLASARTMTKVYELNSTPENLVNLQAIMASVNQAIMESQKYAVQVQALKN